MNEGSPAGRMGGTTVDLMAERGVKPGEVLRGRGGRFEVARVTIRAGSAISSLTDFVAVRYTRGGKNEMLSLIHFIFNIYDIY